MRRDSTFEFLMNSLDDMTLAHWYLAGMLITTGLGIFFMRREIQNRRQPDLHPQQEWDANVEFKRWRTVTFLSAFVAIALIVGQWMGWMRRI